MTKEHYLKESKVFCMSPWTHMHGLPSGDVIPCCLSPFEAKVGNLKKESVVEVWNSEKMRQLRLNMLNDIPTPEVCNRCYSKEGSFSTLRSGLNEQYGEKYFDEVVKNTQADGSAELNLVHWDFRFSNICNQKCRTCGPEFSTPWHEDFVKLYKNSGSEYNQPKFLKIVEDRSKFWDMVDPLYSKLQSIHFAGGEPLIMDEHYKILTRLVEEKNTDLAILYSTNFTTLKYKSFDVADLWQHFSNITLSLSIDGTGKLFEVIRHGGKWDDIKKHFHILKTDPRLKKIKYRVHPTVSIMNVFNVTELHEWLLANKYLTPDHPMGFPIDNYYYDSLMLNPLIYPGHYNIQCLPKPVKQRAEANFRKHIEFIESEYGIPGTGFEGLINFMNQEGNPQDFEEFKRMTQQLDVIRNENLLDMLDYLQGYL